MDRMMTRIIEHGSIGSTIDNAQAIRSEVSIVTIGIEARAPRGGADGGVPAATVTATIAPTAALHPLHLLASMKLTVIAVVAAVEVAHRQAMVVNVTVKSTSHTIDGVAADSINKSITRSRDTKRDLLDAIRRVAPGIRGNQEVPGTKVVAMVTGIEADAVIAALPLHPLRVKTGAAAAPLRTGERTEIDDHCT